jgi:hypothetical protein
VNIKLRGSAVFIAGACVLLASASGVACGGASDLPAEEGQAYSFVARSVDGIRLAAILRESDLHVYGFIDEEGAPITPMRFEAAWDFENGGAIVCEQGRWKQIDTEGAVLREFDPSYTQIHSFNGENGVAVRDGRSALIDASGKALTEFEYAAITRYPLNETLFFATRDPDEDRQQQGHWNSVWSKYGLLSADGKELTAPKYRLLDGAFGNDDGYPRLWAVSLYEAEGSGGYLDQNGNEIVPLIYDRAGYFSEGIGYVYGGASSKVALIDASGRLLTDFAFDGVLGFHEGLSLAINEEKYSVIDRTGAVLLNDIGEPQGEFQNGYLKTVRDGKEILIESPIKQNRRTHLSCE